MAEKQICCDDVENECNVSLVCADCFMDEFRDRLYEVAVGTDEDGLWDVNILPTFDDGLLYLGDVIEFSLNAFDNLSSLIGDKLSGDHVELDFVDRVKSAMKSLWAGIEIAIVVQDTLNYYREEKGIQKFVI